MASATVDCCLRDRSATRIADGLARASAVIRLGADRHGIDRLLPAGPAAPRGRALPGPECARGRRPPGAGVRGNGSPGQAVRRSPSAAGAELVGGEVFADHHRYRRSEIEGLLARAARADALCITTTKDAVRLPADLRSRVAVLPVVLRWREPEGLDRLLERALAARRGGR